MKANKRIYLLGFGGQRLTPPFSSSNSREALRQAAPTVTETIKMRSWLNVRNGTKKDITNAMAENTLSTITNVLFSTPKIYHPLRGIGLTNLWRSDTVPVSAACL
jgi:hypothetical protein